MTADREEKAATETQHLVSFTLMFAGILWGPLPGDPGWARIAIRVVYLGLTYAGTLYLTALVWRRTRPTERAEQLIRGVLQVAYAGLMGYWAALGAGLIVPDYRDEHVGLWAIFAIATGWRATINLLGRSDPSG
jgi:hypothetical protein